MQARTTRRRPTRSRQPATADIGVEIVDVSGAGRDAVTLTARVTNNEDGPASFVLHWFAGGEWAGTDEVTPEFAIPPRGQVEYTATVPASGTVAEYCVDVANIEIGHQPAPGPVSACVHGSPAQTGPLGIPVPILSVGLATIVGVWLFFLR